MTTKNTFYITTSIPYMNARVHIGHALEAAQADVIARFHRLQGEKVSFLTGTDEHGKKIQEAAQKAGKNTPEFVDEMAEYYKKVCDTLGVSYDNLIRTSDQEKHWPVVFSVWQKLQENGDIYKGSYEGYYCAGCEAFLREAEMKDGVCLIHKKPVQKISEENYFFRFSKYSKEVEWLIREDVIKILPVWRKAEILNLFSDEEVRDVSFSRPVASVGWGIPVPNDPSQMIYVWADALVNYISGLGGFHSENFKKHWPADIHLIGKDIARFHLMIWPAMLFALGLELPKAVYIHGHISVEGQKMSKSLGNVVDPIELVEKYGVDAARYFLLREIHSGEDGDFSFARFEERYAADLQNGLGNLVSRVAAVGEKASMEIEIKNPLTESRAKDLENYKEAIGEFELNKALEIIWKIVDESNKLVDESRLWEIARTDEQKARATLTRLAENICAISILLLSFLPQTAEKTLVAVGVSASDTQKENFSIRFKKPEQPLFPRIS